MEYREKWYKPKELYSLAKNSVKFQTKEFFNNSTLHGIRYIAEEGRAFGEKFMWFSFVSIGAVAAFVIIGSLWEKFQTNPTITGLDTDFHDQQVFFPAVTICPEDAFDDGLVNETASEIFPDEDSSERFVPVLRSIPNLSYRTLSNAYEAVLNMSNGADIKAKQNLRQLAFKVAKKCEDLLEYCEYKKDPVTCCDFFKPIYSEQGFCYTFNAKYIGEDDKETRNERIYDLFETDKRWSLLYVPTGPSKVYIHSVDEVTSHDIRPTFDHDTSFRVELLITMKQTYTTEDARQLTVSQRKCIFSNDVKSKYYKDDIYTFTACMKYCRLERANKYCKCIPSFYMPETGNFRQCGLDDFACLEKYQKEILDIKQCRHCELNCYNTVYDIEKYTKTAITDPTKYDEYHVIIEFLTWPIVRYKREVLFGWVDLLVSFGGIAGLFLGFSLLTGVEIIYYFTMRAGCMVYKNRDELYVAQEEEKSRSVAQYDLGLRPKLRKSDRKKSLSMSNVHTVKPVESAGSNNTIRVKAFDSPKVPIKKKKNGSSSDASSEAQMQNLKGGDGLVLISNRLNKLDMRSVVRKKLFAPARQNPFQSIQVVPYAQNNNNKPSERRFRFRSHSEGPDDASSAFYGGYLP